MEIDTNGSLEERYDCGGLRVADGRLDALAAWYMDFLDVYDAAGVHEPLSASDQAKVRDLVWGLYERGLLRPNELRRALKDLRREARIWHLARVMYVAAAARAWRDERASATDAGGDGFLCAIHELREAIEDGLVRELGVSDRRAVRAIYAIRLDLEAQRVSGQWRGLGTKLNNLARVFGRHGVRGFLRAVDIEFSAVRLEDEGWLEAFTDSVFRHVERLRWRVSGLNRTLEEAEVKDAVRRLAGGEPLTAKELAVVLERLGAEVPYDYLPRAYVFQAQAGVRETGRLPCSLEALVKGSAALWLANHRRWAEERRRKIGRGPEEGSGQRTPLPPQDRGRGPKQGKADAA